MFENIQIEHGNFSVDVLDGSGFYTIDHEDNKLIKKTSSGTLVSSNFLDTDISKVYSLEYDGVNFWTLEKTGTIGFTIRRLELGSDSLVRTTLIRSYTSDAINSYDVYSMALEWYSDSLDNVLTSGATSFDVNDGSVIRAGDIITIGPSTATGFEGNTDTMNVTSVVGSTVTVSPAISTNFSPNDPLFFTRNVFVFSDTAPANPNSGAVYKFNVHTGGLLSSNSSNLFFNVRAATFFKDYVMFLRGSEIIWYNPISQKIFKTQAVDNLNESRTDYITTYDLTGYSDTIYRLEDKRVYLDSGSYTTEEWDELNYNTSITVPQVYFVIVKATPEILQKSVSGYTPESEIFAQVLDQFKTPVFGKTVDFSVSTGLVSPAQDTTDANGVARTTYTGTSSPGEVEITASVS